MQAVYADFTGLVMIGSVSATITDRFAARPEVASGNARAARAAFDYVAAELAGLGLQPPASHNGHRRASGANTKPGGVSTGGGRVAQIEGSAGVAAAVARCRPEVICAYPISPQ